MFSGVSPATLLMTITENLLPQQTPTPPLRGSSGC